MEKATQRKTFKPSIIRTHKNKLKIDFDHYLTN